MSLHLLQVEQLSKASQVGGGRQQFSCVPKVHTNIGSNGRHFVAAFFQFRSAPGLKQVRHEVALQQNMVVTGSAKKVVFFVFKYFRLKGAQPIHKGRMQPRVTHP